MLGVSESPAHKEGAGAACLTRPAGLGAPTAAPASARGGRLVIRSAAAIRFLKRGF